MSDALRKTLLGTPPASWQTRQAVVLEWYDGPREGICELAAPECTFYFEILAERWADGRFDDRLFRIYELSKGAVAELVDAFRASGPPTTPIWAPQGSYDDDDARHRVEEVLDKLLSTRVPTRLIIRTLDMQTFSEVWLDTTEQ